MMEIELLKWNEFNRKWAAGEFHPAIRFGQALHHYLGLEKTTQFKEECDRLYQMDGDRAKAYAKTLFLFK